MFELSDGERKEIMEEANMKATQQQVKYVYLLASKCDYDKDYVHDVLRPSHLTRGEISNLIEELKIEAGMEDDVF